MARTPYHPSMSIGWIMCVAFACPLSHSTAPARAQEGRQAEAGEWRAAPRVDSQPVRYLVRSRRVPDSPELAGPLGIIVCDRSADSELERALDDVARALAAEGAWTLAACAGSTPELTAVAEHLRASSSTSQRLHLIGHAAGATAALQFAIAEPERVASVTAFAPVALDAGSLRRVGLLSDIPLALLRGRTDAREPLLEVLERLIAAGGVCASLDFVSTKEHATVLECEGRFTAHWKRFVASEAQREEAERGVRARLGEFHAAASRADLEGYFACLAPDAVFIGTDASERWNVTQFRAFCEPYFSQGKGWSYVATERHVALSSDRRWAWFDELLDNASYGAVRGSGVLRHDGEQWKIVHYVMSFPVPNELAQELTRRIRDARR